MGFRKRIVLFGLLLLSGCAESAVGPVSAPPEEARAPDTPSPENTEEKPPAEANRATALTLKDLAYATTSAAQKLDLYLPAGPLPAPVVIYVHGGGFRQGDKNSDMVQKISSALMGKGYAVASLNYRLSGEAPFPAAVRDVKTAVRWLRAQAGKYGLDPARIGAWGDSAGANLVSLLGTSCGEAALEGASLGSADQSSCVQAVVDWYGPTDFLQMDAQYTGTSCPPFGHDDPNSPESSYMGFSIQQIPNLVQKANPITFVTSDDPPFLIQHGTEDCTVPPLQSQIFYDALAPAIGSDNVTLMFLEGAGHGDPQFYSPTNLALVLDFLDKRLKQN